MTKNQYVEMAQNFAKFAGMYVPYKSMNIYHGRGYGELSKYKYNYYQGTLVGVGVEGNAEHFLIHREGWGIVCIHYRYITWPL